jgi:NDP-sugar pyrophosphorylase family protein
MAGVTGGGPKCLLDVQGKPFLWHQLEWMAGSGVTEAILWVNHRDTTPICRAMKGLTCRLEGLFETEETRSGTCGAIEAMEWRATKQREPGFTAGWLLWYEYLLVMGDVMLDTPLPPMKLGPKHAAAMLVTANAGSEDKRNVTVGDGRVVSYVRDGGGELVDCGVWLMRHPLTWPRGTLRAADEELRRRTPRDLEDQWLPWTCEQGAVAAVVTNAYQWHIGNPAGYERMCRDWRPTQ